MSGDSPRKLEKLREEGFFEPYDGFSGWVQEELDRAWQSSPKARLELLKQLRSEKKEELADIEEKIEKLEKKVDASGVSEDDEKDFFVEFFDLLEEKKGSREFYHNYDSDVMKLYKDYEEVWFKKYRSRFSGSLRREEFRRKLQKYMSETELDLNFE